ncbi:MAG: YbhB/YbcL family Raf kinase inhibitor-like protein [Cohnella sp.]|nr:YbhB/YbcL family Raf kinase inhibitor-like protein [Cohnella sp.]
MNLALCAQKCFVIFIMASIAIAIGGCSSSEPDSNEAFTVTTDAFMNDEQIPEKYTSADYSFPLAWENEPKGTKSFAIMIVDLHPVANHWVHWAVMNVPADVHRIPEGASRTDKLPEGSKELLNSSAASGFDPPAPPIGSGKHEYKTVVYALDVTTLESPAHLPYEKFHELLSGYVLGTAEISGYYER